MESLKDLEQKISQKMSDFYEKELGLRPSAVRSAFQGDLLIIRFENALSPSEVNLITQEAGKRLIKEVHEKLAQQILPGIQSILRHLTGRKAVGVDIEFHERGREKVFFITMETPLEEPPAQETPED
ncbi:MAG: Na-translocating system protein MpsC family protein [Nitrospiria bacterium]